MRLFTLASRVAVAMLGLATLPLLAGEAPKAPEASVKTKMAFLFPAVSEIYIAMEADGIKVGPAAKPIVITPVDWNRLPIEQKQLQLGSTLGYLGFAAIHQDNKAVAQALDSAIAGFQALGIAADAASLKTAAGLRDQIKAGTVSQVRVLALLDEFRRDGLRDLSSKVDDKGVATILSGAWLRGSALLATDLKTDADVKRVAEFLARPELVKFLDDFAVSATAPAKSPQGKTVEELIELSQKKDLTVKDLAHFAELAQAIFAQPAA